ncbi:hypothetical protein [Aeromonas ichthyocola]
MKVLAPDPAELGEFGQQVGQLVLALAETGPRQAGPDVGALGHRLGDSSFKHIVQRLAFANKLDSPGILRRGAKVRQPELVAVVGPVL